jgi:GPH family glycoside/pentoside/hexuronide:cation symporter
MKTRDKLWYGIGPLGAQAGLRLVEFAPLYFYTEPPLNLQGLYAGIALALSKIVIMFAQFGAGALSDRMKGERWGRRKPFAITGAPLLAISMILLFAPTYFVTPGDQIPLFLYMTFAVCFVNFAYGWISTPYQAWMPELTEPEERTRVSTILNTTNMIGTAMGVAISLIFLPTLVSTQNYGMIIEIMIIASLIQILFYVPAIIKLRESAEKRIKTPSIRREMKVITANKNYMWWILTQGTLSVSIISIQSLVLDFMKYVLNFTSFMDYMIFGIIFIFIAIFSFLIWMVLYRKLSRKRSLTFAMIFLAIILPFSMIIGIGIPLSLFMQGALYVGIVAFTLAGYMLIPYIIMSDIAHEDELKTGEARAGIYMGFNSIPLNLFQALGFFISGYLVSIPDYMGYRYFGPVLAVFLVLGVIVLQKVKVDFDLSKVQKAAKKK